MCPVVEGLTEAYSYIGTGAGRTAPIFITEEGNKVEHFLLPAHYVRDLECVLIPYGYILDRIEKLAHDIKNSYAQNTELHVICILKGSRGFFTQLLAYLNKITLYSEQGNSNPPYMEHYVRLKSYSNDKSTGKLQVISENLAVLGDKDVLIVEDIIDTGHTLSQFVKFLVEVKPRSVKVASLLEKRTDKSVGFKGDFVGFSCPDGFVVGFSLDYNEYFRDLDHICIINRSAIQKYRTPSSDVAVETVGETVGETVKETVKETVNGKTANGH
eukprot:Platyproteum_vivax@DN1639_c0_g1_i1.p1